MDPSLRHFLSTLQAKVEGEVMRTKRAAPLCRSPARVTWHTYRYMFGVFTLKRFPRKWEGFI